MLGSITAWPADDQIDHAIEKAAAQLRLPLLQPLAGIALHHRVVVGRQLLKSLAEHIAAGGGGKAA